MHELLGTYAGIVEANNDPEKLGRVKVRVPHVYGVTGSGIGYIGTNDIPWALPSGMPAGSSVASGGFTQLPEAGDKVWVRFLDGEPEKPVWEWGMQSQPDRDALALHTYDSNNGKVGKPNRTAWTRYGHTVEINVGAVIVTTSGGYRVVLTDSSTTGAGDGNVTIETSNGNFFELDDSVDTATLNSNEDCTFVIGSSFSATSDSFSWTTATQDFTFTSGGKISSTASDDISFTTSTSFGVDAIDSMNLSAGTTMDVSSGTDLSITSGASVIFTASSDFNITSSSFNLSTTSISLVTDDFEMTGSTISCEVLSVSLSATTAEVSAGAFTVSAGAFTVSGGTVALEGTAVTLGAAPSEPFVLGLQLVAWLTSLQIYLDTHMHSNGNMGANTGVPTTSSTDSVQPPPALLISTTVLGSP